MRVRRNYLVGYKYKYRMQEEGITYGFESEPASNQSGDKISFFQTYSIAQMRNEKKEKRIEPQL